MVDSYVHQIHSKYYDGNKSVSIEDIVLENFSTPTQTEKSTTPKANTHHAACSLIFLMTENKILPQLLNTANASLNC